MVCEESGLHVISQSPIPGREQGDLSHQYDD